jgi:transcriptional regulator GlxA family with amidase domain
MSPTHIAIWLPSTFYSAVASTIVETLQVVNDVSASPVFTYEFLSRTRQPVSTTGIRFLARAKPSRQMDALILLAPPGLDVQQLTQSLDQESRYTRPLIELAHSQGASIAALCGASYLLADVGLLNGKRATIAWWLKQEALRRFPRVRWDASRLIVRQGRVYTSGAGFSGLELVTTLLVDLGFASQERLVRKIMVLPPPRRFQSPYELPLAQMPHTPEPFQAKLDEFGKAHLRQLSLPYLARHLSISQRTLARRFMDELHTSPGQWIKQKRLEAARVMLETTPLNVAEICYRVGYQDVASFSRLFSRTTGMAPGEFRKHLQGRV